MSKCVKRKQGVINQAGTKLPELWRPGRKQPEKVMLVWIAPQHPTNWE